MGGRKGRGGGREKGRGGEGRKRVYNYCQARELYTWDYNVSTC